MRSPEGEEIWLVAVKGTFHIRANEQVEIAEEQQPICHTPEYLGKPGLSSLLYDSDLLINKPATDIIVRGHAYSDPAFQRRQCSASLHVGSATKTLRVFGDRKWDRGFLGPRISSPEKFERMPIVYERAFGGSDRHSDHDSSYDWEMRNPIGAGFATSAERIIGKDAPNIEYINALITSWDQRPAPAGFGPIAPNWTPRLEWAGTYDALWERERMPLSPVDFDYRFHQCAPIDQQWQGRLQGGEPIELKSLSPSGDIRFRLPTAQLKFVTDFRQRSITHEATIQTLQLEPDLSRLIITWVASLPCHHDVYNLEETNVSLETIVF